MSEPSIISAHVSGENVQIVALIVGNQQIEIKSVTGGTTDLPFGAPCDELDIEWESSDPYANVSITFVLENYTLAATCSSKVVLEPSAAGRAVTARLNDDVDGESIWINLGTAVPATVSAAAQATSGDSRASTPPSLRPPAIEAMRARPLKPTPGTGAKITLLPKRDKTNPRDVLPRPHGPSGRTGRSS